MPDWHDALARYVAGRDAHALAKRIDQPGSGA
jgi:hypothetical protein